MDEYRGQPYALSMHPSIFRRIALREEGYNYLYPNTLGKIFLKFLLSNGYELQGKSKKYTIINVAGKNFGSFDLPFLKHQTNFLDFVRIRHRIIDPSILCLEKSDQSVPDTQECLKRIGIEKKIAHTAIDDAFDVIKNN